MEFCFEKYTATNPPKISFILEESEVMKFQLSSASVRLVEWSFEWITWNYHHEHCYYHLKGEISLMGLSPLACDN